MLRGTADPEALASTAATLDDFDTEPGELRGVDLLQAMFELRIGARESVLPPALHPTNPPTVVFQVMRVAESPWGPFGLAQVRVGCRSGLRPRGFVLDAVCDEPVAGDALARGWGFACRPGGVRLRRGYDEVVAEVTFDGDLAPAFALRGADAEPLSAGDVSYSDSLNLARTPNGLRLVQVEVDVGIDRVERLRPDLGRFPPGWGHPLLEPYHPVSATLAAATVVLRPLRFVCRPDVLAFEGTESVGAAATA